MADKNLTMAEIRGSEEHLDATAGPVVPSKKYDVFLNHRGLGVKKGFVSHLAASLEAVGARTFVRYEELHVGDQAWDAIKSTIRHTKVQIAVFSRGYAYSSWCLRELHEMLQCRTDGCSQRFLPVFVNVAPSDLLNPESPESCYSEAFAKLRKRNSSDVIDEWILALAEASMVMPRQTFDSAGFEVYLVKLIVSDVIQVLNLSPLSIAKYPVGVDEKRQEALDLMEFDKVQQGLHKLAICGMGGVGKTTLAKSIYNLIHTNFDGSCFIESVRIEAESSRGLPGLQEHILCALLKNKATINVSSISHGEQLMIDRLSGLKILIILDDIDNQVQLDALVSPFETCYVKDGSHLVITSRNEQIVVQAKVQPKLYMERLSEAHANLLFNCHAFLRPAEPPEELKELAKKAVKACQGLPLALEALGAHLYDKDVALWQTTVEVLEGRHRIYAPALREVISSLKTSYDGLCIEEKMMFLDIACIMLGESEDGAKRIWCKPDAMIRLETLRLKSLVKLDQYRRLTMHDLLRDMGREIVERSHPNIWQRSHLWDETDVHDVLRWRKGASEVRAVRLPLGDQGQWNTKSFARMDSLRFLVLTGKGRITGNFRVFPKQLRWLKWHECPWKSLPRKLDLSKVAVLDLAESAISSLSNGHMFENLRDLNLRSCSLLKELPDFRVCCKKLEVLDLFDCRDLESVPESIGFLSSTLTHLDLCMCRMLTTLPDALVGLHFLKSLKLDGCTCLTRLPDAIGQLTALEEMSLRKLKSLVELPQSLGSLAKLSTLDLNGSQMLQELPSTVGNLRKLSFLNVSGTGIREIPAAVYSLTNLVELMSSNYAMTVSLPKEIGNLCNLERLDLKFCNIEERGLPKEISGLSSLRHLNLSLNYLLWRVPKHLHLLTRLKTLHLLYCTELREIPQLPSSLEELKTDGCKNLREVHMFPPSLIHWSTRDCPSLMRLPSLYPREGLAHLEQLEASGCTGLRNDAVEQFAGLASLKRLYLAGTGVSFGPWIEKLVSLEQLLLDGKRLPEFIRYKQQAPWNLNERMESHIKVIVPHTGEGMECKGVVLCAVARTNFTSLSMRIHAPGGEEKHYERRFWDDFPGDLESNKVLVQIIRACLEGGTILTCGRIDRGVVPEVAVRLVHEDYEFEEIKSELALARWGGGKRKAKDR